MHPDIFFKDVVSNDVKSDKVKDDVKLNKVKDDVKPGVRPVVFKIGVGQHFRNEQLFIAREHTLQWIRMEARKLGFGIVIRRPDNGSNRR